jgi:hypothetical protein
MLWELPQALEITFEVQKKTSNEERARGKISLPTYRTHFFLFPFLWTLPAFKASNFLISCSF